MAGKYTEKIKTYKNIIKSNGIANEDGEVINPHDRCLDNIIMDIINMEEQEKERKVQGAIKSEENEQFRKLQQEVLGNFVFFLYSDINWLQKELSDSDLVKFIYLGTYVKSDGALKLDNNKTNITKKMLVDVLNLNSRDKANKFYNSMINKNLLEDRDGFLYINTKYFFRGRKGEYKKLTKNKLKEFTRIYIESTRNLYNETSYRKHRQLATAYKLLPFCNYKYNILCKNPNETDKELIEPLELSEILKLLKYDNKHLKKLVDDLMSIQTQNYSLFMRVGRTNEIKNDHVLVNPLGYYRGSDEKELEYLLIMFEIIK